MPDWLPSAIASLVSTFIGAGAAYAAIKAKTENLDTRLKTMEGEVSTLRARSHEHTNSLLRIDSRVLVLEDRDER